MQETWVRSLGQEDPLEERRATYSVFLPVKAHGQRSLQGCSPWGHKRVRHDWSDLACTHTVTKGRTPGWWVDMWPFHASLAMAGDTLSSAFSELTSSVIFSWHLLWFAGLPFHSCPPHSDNSQQHGIKGSLWFWQKQISFSTLTKVTFFAVFHTN